ncbi:MAG TPA: nitrilase-related carbon-nitrogen hydrolase, partial [Candidatus Limnocylindrales bacterium]|nr:nitrilase-related carbon-nitrogen hydrolase [Candidatus Limnocylindrales bacterium]
MVEALRVGVVQLNSRSDVAANVDRARDLVAAAASEGALLVATPEYTTYLGPRSGLHAAATQIPGPGLDPFVETARDLGVWLLAGVVEAGAPGNRCWNTSVLLAPDGSVGARYRKVHLFDVEVGPVREFESAAIA